MPLLSIVVPMFNSERYAFLCISRILNQTFYNFELIVINDGSVDSTKDICDSFSNDPRVKVFYQKNKGAHKARNLGLKKATGDLITFIDCDDFIPDNYFETLLIHYNENKDIDCVFCDIYDQTNEKLFLRKFNQNNFLLESEDKIISLFNDNSFPGPFAKLFNLKKIKIMGIKFLDEPDFFGFAEDFYFNFIYFMNCKKIFYTRDTYYIYNKTNINSTCNNISSELQNRNNLDRAKVIYAILKYMSDNNFKVEKYTPIFNMMKKHIEWGGIETKRELVRLLRVKNIDNIYKNIFSVNINVHKG